MNRKLGIGLVHGSYTRTVVILYVDKDWSGRMHKTILCVLNMLSYFAEGTASDRSD